MVSIMLPFTLWPIINLLRHIKESGSLLRLIIGIVALGLEVTFLVIMKLFIAYHCGLIDKNMTTIDHLDIKRGRAKDYNFDFGTEWNWKSIFG